MRVSKFILQIQKRISYLLGLVPASHMQLAIAEQLSPAWLGIPAPPLNAR